MDEIIDSYLADGEISYVLYSVTMDKFDNEKRACVVNFKTRNQLLMWLKTGELADTIECLFVDPKAVRIPYGNHRI